MAMIQLGFLALTGLLALVLFLWASRIASIVYDAGKQRRFKIKTALLLVGWLAYISILSVADVFTNATLPPRIPLLLILPAFAFFIYFFTNKQMRQIVAHTPPAWPVYFQCFRIIVELLLLGMFLDGQVPKAATFEGCNFDILIGITAPVVAYFTYHKRAINKKIALVWNFAGLLTLLVVVFILLSHAYFFSRYNEPQSMLGKGLGTFPYIFLAGFFMPLAVFMHVFSIIKIRKG